MNKFMMIHGLLATGLLASATVNAAADIQIVPSAHHAPQWRSLSSRIQRALSRDKTARAKFHKVAVVRLYPTNDVDTAFIEYAIPHRDDHGVAFIAMRGERITRIEDFSTHVAAVGPAIAEVR